MVTRFIGVKEFRQNVAKIADRSRKNNERFIILRRNEPILEIRPLSKKDASLERLMLDVQQGKEDIKQGRVYTQDEVESMLGL
jgi:hypothetical protein